MHVISLIVRIRLPLVSSESDQYPKSYGCFSYSDVVGRARSRVKWSIWRAISWTTEQIEMSFGKMAPTILTDIISQGFWVTWSISRWSAPWSAGIRYFTVFSQSGLVLPATQRILGMVTQNLVYEKALIQGFQTRKIACPSSLWLLRYCSSNIAISLVNQSKIDSLTKPWAFWAWS